MKMFHHIIRNFCNSSSSRGGPLPIGLLNLRQSIESNAGGHRSIYSSPIRQLSKTPHYCARTPISEHGPSIVDSKAPASDSLDEDYFMYKAIENSASNNLESSPGSDIDTPKEWSSENQLSFVRSEYELLKQGGELQVPSSLTEDQWQKLTSLLGPTQRRKYLRFIFLTNMAKQNEREKKTARRGIQENIHQELQQRADSGEDLMSRYGLWGNSIFLKLTLTMMNGALNHKLVAAKLYGQPLIFDYGYDADMVDQERSAMSKQMLMAIGSNRRHSDPFDMQFFNFDSSSPGCRLVEKNNPHLTQKDCLIDTHRHSYTDAYPRDRLVCLTPHAREDMETVDPNTVYVIPAVVLKGGNKSVTLAKAKRLGIRTQRLPLDRYVKWQLAGKHLPLNTILNVLLHVRTTGSWVEAFHKFLPKRTYTALGEGSDSNGNTNVGGRYGGDTRRRGGDYGRQRGNFRPRGGDYGRQGGDYGRQGGEYGRQGGEYGRQGGEYGRQGGEYGRKGGEYGRQGGEYGRQGGDYGRQDGDYRPRGSYYGRQGGDEGRYSSQSNKAPSIASLYSDQNVEDGPKQPGVYGKPWSNDGNRDKTPTSRKKSLASLFDE